MQKSHDEFESWASSVCVRDITPNSPSWLNGYGHRTEPHAKVLSRIYAKALALRDPQGKVAVVITVDLCMVDSEIVQSVKQHLTAKHAVSPEAQVINASHTHSGPCVWSRAMQYGFKVGRCK